MTVKNVDFIKLNPLKNPFKITLNNPLQKNYNVLKKSIKKSWFFQIQLKNISFYQSLYFSLKILKKKSLKFKWRKIFQNQSNFYQIITRSRCYWIKIFITIQIFSLSPRLHIVTRLILVITHIEIISDTHFYFLRAHICVFVVVWEIFENDFNFYLIDVALNFIHSRSQSFN